MDLSIVIVSYNTRPLTLACLQSLFEQTSGIDFEVIVVDNGSSDDTAHAIAENFPQVQLITSDENRGFSFGNNLAAQEAKGEYLLLLNPDTVVLDRAIEKLFAFAKAHPEAGIYGGRTIFPDGTINPTCCFGKMTGWSLFCRAFGLSRIFKHTVLFNPETYGSWKFDAVKQVAIITGCFLMIKTDLWQQLNGFNPLFLMFGEEVDLCLRATKLGHHPLFTPDATIIHYGGASEPARSNRLMKVLRAESTLIREHWPAHKIRWGIYMLAIWVRMKSATLAILAGVNSAKFGHEADVWKNLWQNRAQWLNGWADNREL